jgi:signal transduction histidine kinase
MNRLPALRTGLLDLAAAIGLAGPALMVLESLDRRPVWMSSAIAVLLVAGVLVWTMWRRSGQRSRPAAAVFVVTATAILILGNGPLFFGIVWTACLVIGVTFTSGLLLWAYAVGLVGLVIVLHLTVGSSSAVLTTEAVATAIFAGIAAANAGVLRDSLRVGDALQDALARLDGASRELRRRLDSDRDLILAKERERTARELHDDLGHRLTAIGLSLDYAARVGDRATADEELVRARRLVVESLDAMRRLVRAMHPVELGTLADVDAFRAVADAFRGTGIDIRVDVGDQDVALPREEMLLLLRFVQEGLTNVVRHTDARAVDLRIASGQDRIEASMQDSGGRRPGREVSEGFGLRGLRGRAEELGGVLQAGPNADGFRLALSLPARSRTSPSAVPAGSRT